MFGPFSLTLPSRAEVVRRLVFTPLFIFSLDIGLCVINGAELVYFTGFVPVLYHTLITDSEYWDRITEIKTMIRVIRDLAKPQESAGGAERERGSWAEI